VVSGAAGRMGRRLLELVQQDPETQLVGALESAGHPAVGQPAVSLCSDVPAGQTTDVRVASELPPSLAVDVVIDFSVPDQTVHLARRASDRGWAMVVGTTGLDAAQQQELQAVAS